jgi:hypothetical protein
MDKGIDNSYQPIYSKNSKNIKAPRGGSGEMTKKKDKKDLLPQGRPTKYKSEYDEQGYRLTLLGLTDKQIADFFEVNEDTINEWKKIYSSFSESLKAGKENSDANIVKSLYKRATGMTIKEVDIKVIDGEIVKTVIDKELPPDPTACFFWLKNRQPKMWRDKQEIENSGNIGIKFNGKDVEKYAKDLQDKLRG